MRLTDSAPKNLAVSYLSKQKSFAYTFKVLQDLEKSIMGEIRRLGGNSELEAFMTLIHCPDLHSASVPCVNGTM
jgi:hypothetical protein